MLEYLKNEDNRTFTENGAVTYATTHSDCLDLFAAIGALRSSNEQEIRNRFARAYTEDYDLAMKLLFFARDVRGGLGERRVFRICLPLQMTRTPWLSSIPPVRCMTAASPFLLQSHFLWAFTSPSTIPVHFGITLSSFPADLI